MSRVPPPPPPAAQRACAPPAPPRTGVAPVAAAAAPPAQAPAARGSAPTALAPQPVRPRERGAEAGQAFCLRTAEHSASGPAPATSEVAALRRKPRESSGAGRRGPPRGRRCRRALSREGREPPWRGRAPAQRRGGRRRAPWLAARAALGLAGAFLSGSRRGLAPRARGFVPRPRADGDVVKSQGL
ncbi:uncharacterized protein LOC144366945 [Ictidomys tridecemlineatus]